MNSRRLSYWLAIEKEWEEKKGIVEDRVWYSKMVSIYKKLVECAPENKEYRKWLEKYLMEYAEFTEDEQKPFTDADN